MDKPIRIMPCLDMQNGRVVKGVHSGRWWSGRMCTSVLWFWRRRTGAAGYHGDGAQTGYDLPVIRAIKEAVSADVVASGGAGKLEHFYEAVQAGATVLLAASMFHFGIIGIGELKDYLRGRGVAIC